MNVYELYNYNVECAHRHYLLPQKTRGFSLWAFQQLLKSKWMTLPKNP